MIEYRMATEADLPMIVETHIKCFPDYFLTSLGKKLLYLYYKSFFDECNLFLTAYDEGKMVAFTMGNLHTSRAKKNFEKKNAVRLFFRVLFLCIKFDKNALERVSRRLVPEKKEQNQMTEPPFIDVNWLSLCVLDEYRKMNIASELAVRFESLLKQYNVKNYGGRTRRENIKMQKFFEKHGFYIADDNKVGILYLKNVPYED